MARGEQIEPEDAADGALFSALLVLGEASGGSLLTGALLVTAGVYSLNRPIHPVTK
jgi:hypothetical protein